MKHFFIRSGNKSRYGVSEREFLRIAEEVGITADHSDILENGFRKVHTDNPDDSFNVVGTVEDVEAHPVPTIKEIEGIPADSNPFHYDHFSMGSDLTRGWMVMHPGFDNKENPYPLGNLTLVNLRTGQRFLVTLNDEQLSRYKEPT